MANVVKFLVFITLLLMLNGCVLTKVLSVPLRTCGAVISIIPVAGNTAHDAIDKAADIVDEIPI